MRSKTLILFAVLVAGLLLAGMVGFASGAGRAGASRGDEVAGLNRVLYVRQGRTGDCSSWGEACMLQTALETAVSGDEIWVAAGLYKPADTSIGSTRNCQDIRDRSPSAPDGEYLISPGGRIFPVYCHDMAGTPRDYLTLGGVAGTNFAQYTAGGPSPGTDVRTTYQKVRLNPITLQVDIGDQTFATSQGSLTHGPVTVTSMPYGVAMDCLGSGSQTGVANINLVGTSFVVSDTFLVSGYNAAGTYTITQGNRVVDLAGGGYCGWIAPAPPITDPDTPFNASGGFRLDLAWAGMPPPDTFLLMPGVALYGGFPATGDPGFEERDWEDNLTILSGDIFGDDGTDADGVITDTANIVGENNFHVVTVGGPPGPAAVLDGFIVTGGDADGLYIDPCGDACGGGVYNPDRALEIRNSVFTGNMARIHGGGVANAGTMAVTDSRFSGNKAKIESGGGIANEGALEVVRSTFTGNNSAYSGGGIANRGEITVTESAFTENESSNIGGGMYTLGGNPILTQVTFNGNQAGNGGGFYNDSGSPILTSVSFVNNQATMDGGGFLNFAGSPALTSTTFISNVAIFRGGGFSNWSGSPTLASTTFTGNRASAGGGVANLGTITITQSSLTDNWAGVGGGIANSLGAKFTLKTSTIGPGNSAGEIGGGIYNEDVGVMSISDSAIVGNSGTATTGGGGIANGGILGISNSTVSANFTNNDGGGIYHSGNLILTNTTVTGNTADYDQSGYGSGAGIYIANPGAVITLTNSIIADNETGGDCAGYEGWSLTSLGHNIDSDGSCQLTDPDDQPNTEPLLGPLADNGGLTPTHALLAGSPAIDAADPAACPAADQRGVPRPIDGDGDGSAVCDIGAFEAQIPTTTTVTADVPDPSVAGKPFNVSFTVTSTLGIPTGVVTVTARNSPATCGATLVDGLGGCELTLSAVGTYTLTAAFTSEGDFAPSTDTEPHAVWLEVYLPMTYKQ